MRESSTLSLHLRNVPSLRNKWFHTSLILQLFPRVHLICVVYSQWTESKVFSLVFQALKHFDCPILFLVLLQAFLYHLCVHFPKYCTFWCFCFISFYFAFLKRTHIVKNICILHLTQNKKAQNKIHDFSKFCIILLKMYSGVDKFGGKVVGDKSSRNEGMDLEDSIALAR